MHSKMSDNFIQEFCKPLKGNFIDLTRLTHAKNKEKHFLYLLYSKYYDYPANFIDFFITHKIYTYTLENCTLVKQSNNETSYLLIKQKNVESIYIQNKKFLILLCLPTILFTTI